MRLKCKGRFGFLLIYIIVIVTILAINSGLIQAGVLGMCLTLLVMLFFNKEDFFVSCIALTPLVTILKIPGSITIAPLMILLGIVKILFKETTKIRKEVVWLFFIFGLINVTNSFLRFGFQPEVFSFILLLIYIYLVMNSGKDILPKLFDKIAYTFIVSMVIYCIGSDIFPNVVNVVAQKGEFTTRNVGFTNDWSYGQFLALAVAFCTIQVRAAKISVWKYIFLTIVFFYYLIQTGSYTGLMAISLFFILFPFSTTIDSKKKLYIALFSTALILISFVFITAYIFPKMLEVRSGNFGNNGRFDLWTFYLNLFLENIDVMLCGVGIGCIKIFANQLNMLTTHNVIIEKLVELGLIGFSIFSLLLYKISKGAVCNIRKNEKLLVLITMLSTLMVQGVSGNPLPFFLMPATLFVDSSKKDFK